MRKKLLRNTVTSLLLQFVTVISGFILPRLILEQYGSEVNGLTQSIKQFLGIITFLELGVGQVIQSNLYKPLAKRDHAQISSVLKSGAVFFRKIAYALIAYVVVLVAVYPLMIDHSFQWLYTATLIIAISIGNLAQYYFGIIDKLLLNADQKGYVHYISQIISVVLNAVISVIVIRSGQSIQLVMLCSSLIFLIRPLAVRCYINRRYSIDRKVTYSGEPVRQKWNGIAQHVSAVVLDNTDTIVLTLLSTLSDVSIYSVHFLAISGIKHFYEAATTGVQAAVGSLWASDETDKLNTTFARVEMVLHFVVVFLFCCIGVLIVPFIRVYTDGLTDANYIQPLFAAILTLAYGIRCLRTPYNILILAAGHYKQTQRCHIIAAVLNLCVSVCAVFAWGLVGVAIGTLIAMVYQTAWMMVYNTKNLLCWPWKRIVKQLAADLVAVGAILAATCWIDIGSVSYWGWICMAVPVALIALAITVLTAVAFYGKDIKQMLKSLSRRR